MAKGGMSSSKGLRVPPRIIRPSYGELPVNCDICGGFIFRVLVIAKTMGAAKVVRLVCDNKRCMKIFRLDNEGNLGGAYTPNKRPDEHTN